MNRKLIIFLTALTALLMFSSGLWFYETQYLVGRADVTQYSFSVDNSYVFISPLQAKANNEEKIRVTVFVLNNQGLGVLGKKVEIKNEQNLTISTVQGLSDNYGKSIFDITSDKTGDYFISVIVDGRDLPQKTRVSFN